MKKLKIIDCLHLNEDGVRVKAKNGRFQQVHLRQGELDGACAVYSAFMALICIGVVKYNDIAVYGNTYDKRYGIERLKKELFELKGLHRDGNDFSGIKQNLEKGYRKHISVEHYENSDEQEILEIINKTIQEDIPVVISCMFSGGAHAMLAVGVEYDDKGKHCKILCLDPDTTAPNINYFNCVIDLYKSDGKYQHYYFNTKDNSRSRVKLDEILVISGK